MQSHFDEGAGYLERVRQSSDIVMRLDRGAWPSVRNTLDADQRLVFAE